MVQQLDIRRIHVLTANQAIKWHFNPLYAPQNLIGGKFAPESVESTDFNPNKRWQRVQELVRHYWDEWLPTLNQRQKWFYIQEELKEDDVGVGRFYRYCSRKLADW